MKTEICLACGGSGEAWYNYGDPFRPDERLESCRSCGGIGQVRDYSDNEFFQSLDKDTRKLLKKRKTALEHALEAIKRFKKS